VVRMQVVGYRERHAERSRSIFTAVVIDFLMIGLQ
jgi:hypothetical protein